MSTTKFNLDDFRDFINFPTVIFAKFDERGILVSINDSIEEALGWKPQEIIGRKYTEFLSADDCQTFSITSEFQQGHFRHKNGEWKIILWAARKRGRYFLVMGREVTDRLEFEESLTLASDRLSLAMKMGMGTFEWWPERNKIFPDETAERIYGFEPGTIGRDASLYTSFIHPDDFDWISKAVRKAVADVERYVFEYRIIRKDGELRWIKVWGQPIKHNGETRIIGMFLDISDQKFASEEQRLLSRVSEILSSSFDYVNNIREVFILLTRHICDMGFVDHYSEDLKTKRIEVRKKAGDEEHLVSTKIFTTPSRETSHPLIQRLHAGEVVHVPNVDQLFSELSSDYPEEYLEEIRTRDTKSNLVVLLRRHDHILGALAIGLYKDTKRIFTERDHHIVREISYRISMAMDNSLLYISSQEAVHARDEFLSVASHELKTPLQSLTLQNEMLARQLNREGDDKQKIQLVRKSLESDRKQLNRITRLIEDMLDITRIQNSRMKIEKELIDFSGLLSDIVERMRPAFESQGMPLGFEGQPDLMVHADAFRIEQVITNILTNALKYGDNRPVNIRAWSENGELIFQVIDQGHGIRAEDQKRIFQRFERAGNRTGVSGLGLGLHICHKIVEAHNGKIKVESELEKGSTFTIVLPLR